jgi:outer membrane protein
MFSITINNFKEKFVILPLLLFLLLFLSVRPAVGQDTLRLSLSDAIRVGLEQNYQIRISDEQLKIAQNNNTQGAAGRYPSLNFNLSQGNSYNNSEIFFQEPFRNETASSSLTPSVALNWTLFDGFRVNITKENLQNLEELTEGNAALVVENTVQSIILAYYNVLLQNEKLKVLEEVKILSRDRMRYEETKKQFGTAVTFDVLQANDAYLSDSVNYLQQELNLQNANLLLKLLMALEEETAFTVTDDFVVETPDYHIDTLKSRMLRNNKTILNQYINQKILENTTAIAKSELYPNLMLGAGADYSTMRVANNENDPRNTYSFGYYVNFSLGFNIYNGGATKRAIQNALIDEEIGLITLSELQKTLLNQLRNQFDLFNIRKQLLAVAEASQQSTGLNLQIAEEKFKAGAINSFNFRDIQLRYINASIRRLESIYNLIDTETELLRLTGGIVSEK